MTESLQKSGLPDCVVDGFFEGALQIREVYSEKLLPTAQQFDYAALHQQVVNFCSQLK